MKTKQQRLKEIKQADKKYHKLVKRSIEKLSHKNNKKVLDSFFSNL